MDRARRRAHASPWRMSPCRFRPALSRGSLTLDPRASTWLRHARARMTAWGGMTPSFSREGAAGVPMRGIPAQDSGRKAGGNVRRTGSVFRRIVWRPTAFPCVAVENVVVSISSRAVARESHAGSPRFDVAAPRSREDDDSCADMTPSFPREDGGTWGKGKPVFAHARARIVTVV
jgi:hypothetical protein